MNEKKYKFDFILPETNLLYQSLSTQAFDQYGVDIFYLPRKDHDPETDLDKIYQEVHDKVYKNMCGMRVLMEDQQLMQGAGDIFSKFGLEIKDEVTLFITRQEFYDRILGVDYYYDSGMDIKPPLENLDDYRPRVSDLVYIPFWKSLFEVSYVEDRENMVLGRAFWKIICTKHVVDNSEHIDLDQSGINQPMDIDFDISKIDEVINKLKNMDETERTKREDIIMDPDESGFTTNTQDILNPIYEKEAVDVKGDDADYFSRW